MTHKLSTKYAKNYCNRTLIVKVIVENVVTCFLGYSVVERQIPHIHQNRSVFEASSAILEFNMAAITETSSWSYGIPWPLKWGVSNKQNVSTCLSFGVIGENGSKMAAILNFKMAATMGSEYVGGIFFSSPWVGLPLCKVSCLLQKLNDSGALPLYWSICTVKRNGLIYNSLFQMSFITV